MTDKEKLDKLVAEIERRLLPTVRDKHYDEWEEGGNNALINILSFYNSMQEEPQVKESAEIQHVNETCKENGNSLTQKSETIDFEQELYKYFGQVKDFTLGMRIAKRFYEIGRNHQESVSEDLEQTIDTYLATYFGGEKEKQDWPFLKKMAIHFANWQKEQMMAKAVDGAFIRRNRYTKMNVLNGLDTTCDAIQSFKDKDKIKVLFIKED
jgi:hypothetical protein